jgi:hypothetical protein
MLNADKVAMWKSDIEKSVELYNRWFIKFAPRTFRESRANSINLVKDVFDLTHNLGKIDSKLLSEHPGLLPTLRMCTAPPLARDRLVGLSRTSKNLVATIERGKLPTKMQSQELELQLGKISKTVRTLLDVGVFPWIEDNSQPTARNIEIAASIVGDRVSGTLSDPIIRNAQEQHQLEKIRRFLRVRGYEEKLPKGSFPASMQPGTFCFRLNLKVGKEDKLKIPIDAVIKLKSSSGGDMPVLIEAKSAGDYTNTNKRRKEEATKNRQLKDKFGEDTRLILFLRGYFDPGYLGYEAAEGLDWVWEHRIEDLGQLGI